MTRNTMAATLATIIGMSTTPAFSDDSGSIGDALKNGTWSIDARLFYMDRSFYKPGAQDAEALTAGGIMKYESGDFSSFKIALAYYGSHSLFNIVDREKGPGTSLLQSNGDDIAFLGEAYVDFHPGNNQLKVGFQRLSTPLMGDHDLRLLPSVYEAAVYRNTRLPGTLLEAGYVNRYSGFVSKLSGFDSQESKWGKDGLAYVYGKTKLPGVTLQGQYVTTLEDSGKFEDYRYLDASVPIRIGEKSYVKAQLGGTGYRQGDTAIMWGAKAGTTFGRVDLALVYNGIRDNSFQAVESGAMYTDWQQGYGNYEPSDAVGGYVVFRPLDKLSIKLGYVEVESKDDDLFNTDSFGEFNLDANYQITDAAKLRVRYSSKEQTSDSDREDRDDFRIIFYYNI